MLGIYSFGLEESGEYRRAEAAARAALAADPADVWAIHSVAHIAEMEGRPGEGLAELGGARPELARQLLRRAQLVARRAVPDRHRRPSTAR